MALCHRWVGWWLRGYGERVEALRLVWDESFTRYDFGPGHPMSPTRLDLTVRLCRELGLLEPPGIRVTGLEPYDDDILLAVHTPEYVEAVRAASAGEPDPRFGLGSDDNPVFPGMHRAAADLAAATRQAALATWGGAAGRGVNVAGGMHHARRDAAGGFCIYNDVAVAIAAVLEAGATRVAYVDVDAHHGDGVQEAFWDDPRVLTVSVHESGATLFPGTGFATEVGPPAAAGYAVNLPLPAGTGDAGWLRAVHAVVPPLLRVFEPELVVSQHGCDAHLLDPLTHLSLSVDALRSAAVLIGDLADELCGGRWLATGGGGYELVDVVPRAWSHLVGIAGRRPVDPLTEVPEGWRSYVAQRYGRTAPLRMTDGEGPRWRDWSGGYDPADPLDRAVLATRKAVFPLHGLDPWHD